LRGLEKEMPLFVDFGAVILQKRLGFR